MSHLKTLRVVEIMWCRILNYWISERLTRNEMQGSNCGPIWRTNRVYIYIYIYIFEIGNQSTKVFYKLMGWIWVKLVEVLEWWGPLLRGDLVHRVTGQLATVISVVVPCYLVEWGWVGDSNEFLVLFGVWYFWRGWLLAQLEYPGLRGSLY